jgi:uncharacterized protein (TIGR02271 family)
MEEQEMAKTVVALYDDVDQAHRAIRDLVDSGFSRDDISLLTRDTREETGRRETGESKVGEGAGAGAGIGAIIGGAGGLLVGLGALVIPGIGPLLAAGPLAAALAGAGVGAGVGALAGALVGLGIPEQDAEYYSEGIRRGGTLVTVQTSDEMTTQAVDILEHYNPVDIERRSAEWQAQGGMSEHEATRPQEREVSGRRAEFEEVEEELQVGKREVDKGGVRVSKRVYEQPVEEEVRLREERVDVERRKVDRPASEEDLEAFEEGTVEYRERREEPVVSKRARVTEEVDVGRKVEEHTERVSDTVRHSEVDVERMGEERGREAGEITFEGLESTYRHHFDRSYGSRAGTDYDRYRPAYRFGYDLARAERYRDQSWDSVEPDARRMWERQNGDTWNDVRDAVHEGWQQVRESVTPSGR